MATNQQSVMPNRWSTSVETRTFAQHCLSLVVIRVTVYTGGQQGVGAGKLWLLWGA